MASHVHILSWYIFVEIHVSGRAMPFSDCLARSHLACHFVQSGTREVAAVLTLKPGLRYQMLDRRSTVHDKYLVALSSSIFPPSSPILPRQFTDDSFRHAICDSPPRLTASTCGPHIPSPNLSAPFCPAPSCHCCPMRHKFRRF